MEEENWPNFSGKGSLPPLPKMLGGWREQVGDDRHLPHSDLDDAGTDARYAAYTYRNGFDERVRVTLYRVDDDASRAEVEALYPRETYERTARNTVKVAPGRLESADLFCVACQMDDTRIIVYRWVRLADGSELARLPDDYAPTPENYAVVVFCHAEVRPWDANGAQARRNLREVAPLANEALRKAMGGTPRPAQQPPLRPSGDEMAYLTSPLTDPTPGAGKNLLPLTKGNVWQLEGDSDVVRYEVLGDTLRKDVSGVELRATVNRGEVLWEILRRQGPVVLLAAVSVTAASATDARQAPLAVLTPALPLWKEPVTLGDSWDWTGTISRRGPARGVSRVSGRERVVTPAGPFTAYLIETLIAARDDDWRYQSLTWLFPGVGIVRRNALPAGDPEPLLATVEDATELPALRFFRVK
jgi:hypothetical protein